MKRLIKCSSYEVLNELERIRSEFSDFKKVAVFFENENFLATDFSPINPSVHMILEDTKENQLHIQNCNCGYGGAGPNATVRVLKSIGVDESEAKKMIFYNDAVQFEFSKDGSINWNSVDTSIYFYNDERRNKNSNYSIKLDNNVQIDLVQRKIIFFNPQYHSFSGLLKLLSKKDLKSFEYYIGENSPLRNYLRANFFVNIQTPFGKMPDICGTKQVSLSIEGKDIEMSFFVDEQCIIQVIDAIYMAIKHTTLFPEEKFTVSLHRRTVFKMLTETLFKKKKNSLSETISLE